MAVLPRLEMRLVRGSAADGEVGVVMRTTPVEVPPYLLAPALVTSWMCLAPFLALQSMVHAAGRAPAARPARPPNAVPPAADPRLEPEPPGGTGNVVSFPNRARPRRNRVR